MTSTADRADRRGRGVERTGLRHAGGGPLLHLKRCLDPAGPSPRLSPCASGAGNKSLYRLLLQVRPRVQGAPAGGRRARHRGVICPAGGRVETCLPPPVLAGCEKKGRGDTAAARYT